eukprot:scaffold11126_cov64-Phaeocystis_antarctica.AAC.1
MRWQPVTRLRRRASPISEKPACSTVVVLPAPINRFTSIDSDSSFGKGLTVGLLFTINMRPLLACAGVESAEECERGPPSGEGSGG